MIDLGDGLDSCDADNVRSTLGGTEQRRQRLSIAPRPKRLHDQDLLVGRQTIQGLGQHDRHFTTRHLQGRLNRRREQNVVATAQVLAQQSQTVGTTRQDRPAQRTATDLMRRIQAA